MTSSANLSPAASVVEWRPGRSEAMAWNAVAIVMVALGLPLFGLPSILRAGPSGGRIQIGPLDVLLIVALTVLLVVAHEAIHALVMRAFGARPSFGATLVGGVMPAVYATAVGHRFTRGQYVTVALAPAITISVVGFWACFATWGGYLVLPLALHLGGCVGDAFATWRTLRETPGTECEDLRDGIRFYREAVAPTN